MDREEAKSRIRYLAGEVRRHQDLYYRRARPEISDREYDALFDELLSLEKKYPHLAPADSPTRRVGSDLDNDFPEIPHPFPMLSLDKVYNEKELDEWAEKTGREIVGGPAFVIEEKVDGSTIVLHYERGMLVRAVTRGDGFKGNDITENVRTIRDIPLSLSEPVDMVARGEIYLDIPDFKKLNREMEDIYANPRNLAAGSLRRKKSSEVARIPLHSFVYEGFFPGEGPGTHLEVLHRLSVLGFRVGEEVGYFTSKGFWGSAGSKGSGGHAGSSGSPVPPGTAGTERSPESPGYVHIFSDHPRWVRGGIDRMHPYIRQKMALRGRLPYEIDGLVVKVDDNRTRERLGSTAHHPRWAVAFKFESPQAVSRILSIEAQVGRTGRVTPVARIRPVNISGSMVSNVTLHNQDFVTSLDIAPGDTVAVSRRGDVIPAVEEVVEKNAEGNSTYRLPTRCPSCSSVLVQEGAHHFCPNARCPARVFGRIVFFAGRGQMDIENLGPETVRRLIELGLVTEISDIYSFDPAALLGSEGFGEKKVQLIREGIDRSRSQPFSVVLAALGLEEVGPRVVELLIGAGFDSMDSLLQAASAKDPAVFERIHGIGPKTAEKIVRQLNDQAVRNTIRRLAQAGLSMRAAPQGEKESPQVFAGEVWCVTGSFEHFTPRERAMEEVKKGGGRVVSSVTGATTHLLVGENPGSKLEKAKQLGITLVSEKAFLDRLKGS